MSLSDELLLQYLDNRCSEKETEIVEAALLNDPGLVTKYLQLAEDEARIKELLESQTIANGQEDQWTPTTSALPSNPESSTVDSSNVTSSFTQSYARPFWSAVAAMLLLGVALFIHVKSQPNAVESSSVPTKGELRKSIKETSLARVPERKEPHQPSDNINTKPTRNVQFILLSGTLRLPSGLPERNWTALALGKLHALHTDQKVYNPGPRPAVLQLTDGSLLHLRAKTQLAISFKNGAIVSLVKGEVFCVVSKQKKGERFAVRTDHGLATALGTAFSVRAMEAETHVSVLEGLVGFKREDTTVKIKAGQQADTSLPARMSPKAADVETQLAWLGLAPSTNDIFVRTFSFPPAGWRMRGTLVNLSIPGKKGPNISAVASERFWKWKKAPDPTLLLPEQIILIHALGQVNGGRDGFFRVRGNWKMQLKLRCERPEGRLQLLINGRPPVIGHGISGSGPALKQRGFEFELGPLKNGWCTYDVQASEFQPLSTNGRKRAWPINVWRIDLWGFGVGRFELDHLQVQLSP